MGNGKTLGMLVGLAVAGVAFAAGAQGSQQMPQQQQQMKQQQMKPQAQMQPKWEATKHLAVIDVALNSAEDNADMLQKLASEPQAYDKDHGQVFLTNIETALSQAETHYGHLQPLAKTDQQKQMVQKLGTQIQQAKQMVNPIKQDLANATQVQQNARKLEQALDTSQEPIEKIAKQMNVDIDVG